MSSVVISGDTSGTVTLQAPAIAGTTVLTLPATSGTVITTASGTAATATNLAGGSNGTIPYQSASGTTQMLAAGTSGYYLQSNGVAAPTWTAVSASVGDHEYTLTTGNGFGSTNTNIRIFTTVARNVGTAITGANSATLGASATINENGIYSVFYSDFDSGTGQWYGISLNSASLSTSIQSITTYPERLASNQVVAAGRQLCLSVTRLFAIGDVIRPHCTSTMSGANTTNIFSVVKVSK